MLHCEKCNIDIITQTDRCPLCQTPIRTEGIERAEKTYPGFEPLKNRFQLIAKISSAVALASIAILVGINLIFWNGHLWSVVASSYILYAWLLGLLTFHKRVPLGLKLMSHAVFISLTLIAVNAFTDGRETVSSPSWAISYTMPLILVAFMIALNILMLMWKQKRRDMLLYQITLCVFGFVPLILVLVGIAQPILPSAIVAGFSLLTIF
jgi:hypothetical protein